MSNAGFVVRKRTPIRLMIPHSREFMCQLAPKQIRMYRFGLANPRAEPTRSSSTVEMSGADAKIVDLGIKAETRL